MRHKLFGKGKKTCNEMWKERYYENKSNKINESLVFDTNNRWYMYLRKWRHILNHVLSLVTRLLFTESTHIRNGVEIGQCWICAVLWRPFWKWRPVEIVQCWESIRDIIYPHIKFWRYRAMLNFYRPFFIPCFGSHFENGRHLENFENAELLL